MRHLVFAAALLASSISVSVIAEPLSNEADEACAALMDRMMQEEVSLENLKSLAEKCSKHEDKVVCAIAAEAVVARRIGASALGLTCGCKVAADRDHVGPTDDAAADQACAGMLELRKLEERLTPP